MQSNKRGRPPKHTRNFEDTKEALLLAGMAILTERGFNTVGIDYILKRVGVPKGSFYHYFKNKDDFGLQVISEYNAYFCAKLKRCLIGASHDPIEGLSIFVEEAISGIEKYHFTRGCLIGNFAQEMSILSPQFKQPLVDCLNQWTLLLAFSLETAKSKQQISANIDCQEQAECFWIGWEGAVLTSRVMQSSKPMKTFASGFIKQLTAPM